MPRKASKALIAISLLFAGATAPATAADYWGKFKGPLLGGFENTPPRPKFKLSQPFAFEDPNGLTWTVPAGAKVDGASIPQAFWSIIGGPFEGPYLNASVIHDYYCVTKSRTAHDTHRNFYYGMLANGVPKWKAKTMHWAVATFGPDWSLKSKVIGMMSCAGGMSCKSTAALKMVMETQDAPDLEDPEVLTLALAKIAAVARTLKTSEGEILDVGTKGQVDGSLDSLESNAEEYRALFSDANVASRVGQLGILADPNAANLETIQVWDGGKIPASQDLKTYLGTADKGDGFIANSGDLKAIREGLDLKTLAVDVSLKTPF